MSELHLGKPTPFPTTYDPGLLQLVPFTGDGQGQLVSMTFSEFTSLCPVTGQPDFGSITVQYIPVGALIESKSFKLYLGSFRNHPIFHEEVVRSIFQTIQNLLGEDQPLEVFGDFIPRGGVKICSRMSCKLELIRALS